MPKFIPSKVGFPNKDGIISALFIAEINANILDAQVVKGAKKAVYLELTLADEAGFITDFKGREGHTRKKQKVRVAGNAAKYIQDALIAADADDCIGELVFDGMNAEFKPFNTNEGNDKKAIEAAQEAERKAAEKAELEAEKAAQEALQNQTQEVITKEVE